MSLFDFGCWKCIDEMGYPQTKMIYMGHGRFKCPACGAISEDIKDIYTLKIFRRYEDGYLFTEFIELDEKIDLKWCLPEDDFELAFDDLPWGKYICDVYYHWSYSGEDWDCDLQLLSAKEIKQMSKPQGWQFRQG